METRKKTKAETAQHYMYEALGGKISSLREDCENGLISEKVRCARSVELRHEYCVKVSQLLAAENKNS